MNLELVDGWQMFGSEPNQCASPLDIQKFNPNWVPAIVPGTVALSLENAGLWSIDKNTDLDQQDWWYQVGFDLDELQDDARMSIRFAGLATLCDIWLNGEPFGTSSNMFLPFDLPATLLKQKNNQLHLCFRSLAEALAKKKPRPRWRTNLVASQNLRFFRTTLLGRIPGWTPAVAAVGPWKAVTVVNDSHPGNLKLLPSVSGDTGTVDISFSLVSAVIPEVTVTIGETTAKLEVGFEHNRISCKGSVTIENVERWWPHTHGQATLYPVTIQVKTGERLESYDLCPVGFKTVVLDQSLGRFRLKINDREIFCRGACWTVNDIISLSDDASKLRYILNLVRDSGANMLRVGGTMTYESENFFRICDEYGIMVWQDLQFANMDYPVDDDDFRTSVSEEISLQVLRQVAHVSMTVHCGSSEVEQQAAMMGLPASELEDIPLHLLVKRIHQDLGYSAVLVPSSPTGGSLPFHTHQGLSHYYGVGAYLESIKNVRQHNVQFTAECLGFSNIPRRACRDSLFSGNVVATHHPLWKSRIPRDTGAGWDFEDVRDYYLTQRYGVEPVQLRSQDPHRYMQLSEVVSGEMMSRVMQEWRSQHSQCAGALIWFLKDLWPGAGWGIIDSDGFPKAAYYLLKHAWQPVSVAITDESLNGLHFHIVNESSDNIGGELKLALINQGNIEIVSVAIPVNVKAGETLTLESDKILDRFLDITYSYKFGPAAHEVVWLELVDEAGQTICDNSYTRDGREVSTHSQTVVSASVLTDEAGNLSVVVESSHFLYRVNLDVPGYLPEDNYFNLRPGRERSIKLRRLGEDNARFRGYLGALNLDNEIRIDQPG